MDFQAFIRLTFDDIIVEDQTNVFGQIGEQSGQKFTEGRRHFVEIKVMDDNQFAFGHSRIALDRIAQLIGRHRFSVKFKQIKLCKRTVSDDCLFALTQIMHTQITLLTGENIQSAKLTCL